MLMQNWGSPSYKKLTEVKSPALTFAFMEDCDSRGFNVGTWVVRWSGNPVAPHSQSFAWVDPVPIYHGNVSTFAYLDGHSEAHKWVNNTIIG